jgi:hypothetical protein
MGQSARLVAGSSGAQDIATLWQASGPEAGYFGRFWDTDQPACNPWLTQRQLGSPVSEWFVGGPQLSINLNLRLILHFVSHWLVLDVPMNGSWAHTNLL